MEDNAFVLCWACDPNGGFSVCIACYEGYHKWHAGNHLGTKEDNIRNPAKVLDTGCICNCDGCPHVTIDKELVEIIRQDKRLQKFSSALQDDKYSTRILNFWKCVSNTTQTKFEYEAI